MRIENNLLNNTYVNYKLGYSYSHTSILLCARQYASKLAYFLALRAWCARGLTRSLLHDSYLGLADYAPSTGDPQFQF